MLNKRLGIFVFAVVASFTVNNNSAISQPTNLLPFLSRDHRSLVSGGVRSAIPTSDLINPMRPGSWLYHAHSRSSEGRLMEWVKRRLAKVGLPFNRRNRLEENFRMLLRDRSLLGGRGEAVWSGVLDHFDAEGRFEYRRMLQRRLSHRPRDKWIHHYFQALNVSGDDDVDFEALHLPDSGEEQLLANGQVLGNEDGQHPHSHEGQRYISSEQGSSVRVLLDLEDLKNKRKAFFLFHLRQGDRLLNVRVNYAEGKVAGYTFSRESKFGAHSTFGDSEDHIESLQQTHVAPRYLKNVIALLKGDMEVRTSNLSTIKLKLGPRGADSTILYIFNVLHEMRSHLNLEFTNGIYIRVPRDLMVGGAAERRPLMFKIFWVIDRHTAIDLSTYYDSKGNFSHLSVTELTAPNHLEKTN